MFNYSYSKRTMSSNKWVFIIGITTISLVAPLIFNEYDSTMFSIKSILSVAGSLLTTLIMWLGVSSIVIYLWKNFPWETNPVKHLLIEITAIVFYTLLVGIIFYTINTIYPIDSFDHNVTLSIFFTLMITFFMVSLNEGYFFYIKWRETRVFNGET